MKIGKNAATKEYHAAQREVEAAMLRVRQANDELSDACTALKTAKAKLAKASFSSTERATPSGGK